VVGQLARLGEQDSALDMADSSTLGDEPMRRSELHVTPNAESGVKLMTPPVQTRQVQNIRFWHAHAEQQSAATLPRSA
jgi:hypothetical protein